MQKGKRILLVLGLLVGASGLAAVLIATKPEPEKKDVKTVDALVEVLPVQAETVTFSVTSQGTVRPRTETIVSAEVAGAIVEISPRFIAGGVFDRGEVLVRIDPTNYQVAVDQSKALLAQRQIEYDGAAKLRSQGYRAESEYASAAAALASARAELTRAERNLERTQIRLPYAGMVRSKEADLGQYMNVGSRLGVTFSTDAAEVRLPLTDQDLAFVELPRLGGAVSGDGPSVLLSAEQRGQRTTWPATIVRTEGVVDENTRVTFAVARIDDPYRRSNSSGEVAPLPMGSFVAATIEGTTVQDVLRVPRAALRGNGQLVVVDGENRLDIRDVEVLRSDARYVFVRKGLISGERIALTPIENPVNGMRVRTGENTDGDSQLAAGDGTNEATR